MYDYMLPTFQKVDNTIGIQYESHKYLQTPLQSVLTHMR